MGVKSIFSRSSSNNSGNKQKKHSAKTVGKSTTRNLISPTKSINDTEQQQQLICITNNSLHSRNPSSPFTTPTKGILRYSLDDDSHNHNHNHKNRIPAIFALIERGDWVRVEERARKYPRECSVWIPLVKKMVDSRRNSDSSCASSTASCDRYHSGAGSIDGGSRSGIESIGSSPEGGGRMSLASALPSIAGTFSGISLTSIDTSTSSVTTAMACNRTVKCKALHHACTRLRSVHVQIQKLVLKHQYNNEGGDVNKSVGNGIICSRFDDGSPLEEERSKDGDRVNDDVQPYDDLWIQACKAILALVKAHPEAAGERESRHGCLPLHLAAFAMRRTKTFNLDASDLSSPVSSSSRIRSRAKNGMTLLRDPSLPPASPRIGQVLSPSPFPNSSFMDKFSFIDTCSSGSSCGFSAMFERDEEEIEEDKAENLFPSKQQPEEPQMQHNMKSLQKALPPAVINDNLNDEEVFISTDRIQSTERPPPLSTRTYSTASSNSSVSTTISSLEVLSLPLSHQPRAVTPTEQSTSSNTHDPHIPSTQHSITSHSLPPFNLRRYLSHASHRNHYSLLVIKALLKAYPPSPRVDSEGGRLPLHMALEGHAILPVLQVLVDAYPPAARRRTGGGFLPLHLAAERGVGDAGVAGFLLGAYPDGGIARSRFDRTPLEEALLAAGENGRDFQEEFIRSAAGWAEERGGGGRMGGNGGGSNFLIQEGIEVVVNGTSPGPSRPRKEHSEIIKPNLQTIISLVQSRKWKELTLIIDAHPSIVKQKIQATTRAGLRSNTNLLYLVSEQNPTYDIIDTLVTINRRAVFEKNYPYLQTPLHGACTWGASNDVVGYLLAAAGSSKGAAGARQKDKFGNLPLHSACYAGAKVEIVDSLLCTLPGAVETRNVGGLYPIDVVRRLWKGDRGRALREMLENTRIEIEEERRRKKRDDSERDQGEGGRIEKQVNGLPHGRMKPRTPDEKKVKGKTPLSRMLKKGKVEEMNEENDGMMWV